MSQFRHIDITLSLWTHLYNMPENRKIHHRDKISLNKPRYGRSVTPQQATPRAYEKANMHQS